MDCGAVAASPGWWKALQHLGERTAHRLQVGDIEHVREMGLAAVRLAPPRGDGGGMAPLRLEVTEQQGQALVDLSHPVGEIGSHIVVPQRLDIDVEKHALQVPG